VWIVVKVYGRTEDSVGFLMGEPNPLLVALGDDSFRDPFASQVESEGPKDDTTEPLLLINDEFPEVLTGEGGKLSSASPGM
jgi:hypothetical protein